MSHSKQTAITYFRHRHIDGLKLRLKGAEEGRQQSCAASGGVLAVEQAFRDLSDKIVSCQSPTSAAVWILPRYRREAQLRDTTAHPAASPARAPERTPCQVDVPHATHPSPAFFFIFPLFFPATAIFIPRSPKQQQRVSRPSGAWLLPLPEPRS